MDESNTLIDDVLRAGFGPDQDEAVFFVRSVTVRVQWNDEPDAGILWTNQPDTFDLEVADTGDVFGSGSASGANPQGGQGSINAGWNTAGSWFARGNMSLVDTGDAEVVSEGSVMVYVTMSNAGDQTTRLGRTQTDPGNDCVITVTVEGTYFSIAEEGQ